MNQSQSNLKLAERGALISIVAYLILSAAKLATGHLLHSSSLVADGFNNLSDIISNVALLIGIRMARQPADRDHRFGHWKIEDLASLVTSIIMFYVGFDVLRDTIQKILSRETTVIDPLGAIVGVGSALVMFAVYLYNRTLAKKAQSKALKAAAKDNLSDVVTSLGTSVAIGASALNYPIVDQLVAIVITFFILKTAYDIFIESSFSLSDGFDESLLDKYKAAILELPKVSRVKSQRGRTYGSNIYLDVVIEMNPDLSVYESHAITEEVEGLLKKQFGVFDIDVHVEPSSIPEDELIENVEKKLLTYEKRLYAKQEFDTLLADNYTLIDDTGHQHHKAELIEALASDQVQFQNFELESISQKTKLIRYELDGQIHTSLWRRHEHWQKVFHQITSKQEK
ncbi:cation diffusion facilitator family transporter [Streptococcus parasanguinis]|uniref:Cation diffusion facilitator family transporter n=1 Tax=Streptococcus parasanguinis TaxID=1318 RepID=A0A6A8V6Q9_STRPA|nr:cation diffusion facilitator family transporter [Streptococcus parasanguinis]MTS01314.1 cation diffusion facilitator family transporter [Streptococcus parasanguinis]